MFSRLTPPFNKRGRWYTLFIESTDTVAQITKADKALSDTEVSATTCRFPEGFRVVDLMADVHNFGGSATNYCPDVRLFSDGDQGTTLPPLANYDYMTLYVYGYFE